jgi:predicted transposase YbfD/YdcC
MARRFLKQFALMGVLKIADLGHWMLLFRSDNSRIRKVHSPENFAFLRRECGQFTETGERI